MSRPNFSEEKKLWKKGYKYVAGLDEAGRGPLAGPVAAGAVIVDLRRPDILEGLDFKNIRDSKKLSARQREKLYGLITNDKNIKYGIENPATS